MHMRAIYTHYTVDRMVACRKFKSQTDAGYGRGITSDDTQYVQIGMLPCRHLQPLTGSQGLARISKPFNPSCTLHTGTVLYLPSQNALPVTNSLCGCTRCSSCSSFVPQVALHVRVSSEVDATAPPVGPGVCFRLVVQLP
jgi:hypothetical protein